MWLYFFRINNVFLTTEFSDFFAIFIVILGNKKNKNNLNHVTQTHIFKKKSQHVNLLFYLSYYLSS